MQGDFVIRGKAMAPGQEQVERSVDKLLKFRQRKLIISYIWPERRSFFRESQGQCLIFKI